MSEETNTPPPCCLAPQPSSAVLIKNVKWQGLDTLKVAFLEGTNQQKTFVEDAVDRLITPLMSLKFEWGVPVNESHIRITFDSSLGAWSYLGNQALNISNNRATLNLGWLNDQVVVHEFLHALGFAHEMGNPTNNPINWNKDQVYADLMGPPNYWDKRTIDSNVFERYDLNIIDSTDFDRDSIMLYPIPNSWTIGDFEVGFNAKMSELDIKKLQETYPLSNDGGNDENDGSDNPGCNPIGFLKIIFKGPNSIQRLAYWTIFNMANALGGDFRRGASRASMQQYILNKLQF